MPRSASAKAARKAAGAALIAAALGIGLLALDLIPAETAPASWKGYRVLLVDRSVPEAEVLERLSSSGMDRVLSESTEPVAISYWDRPESTGLSAARSRLVQGDPRLDDYLQRLGLWFEARVGGADYRAYYLKSEASPLADAGLQRRLASALKSLEGRYVLADSGNSATGRRGGSLPFALSLLILLAAAAASPFLGSEAPSIGALFSRKAGMMSLDRSAFRLALLLPWAALTSGGLSAAAIAALWGIAFADFADGLDIPMDEYRRGGKPREVLGALGRRGLPAPAFAATALLALIAMPGAIVPVALACLGSMAAVIGYALATSGSAFGGRRFVPIPIGRSRRKGGAFAAERIKVILACACVALWILGGILAPAPRSIAPAGLEYPLPSTVRGEARPMPAEARARSPSETGSTLPGIASFLEHLAYQEALPYLPLGESRPDPFAAASLPLPEGKAQVLSFGDDWARKAYASIPALSLEAMLLAQGSATVGRVSASPPIPFGRAAGGADGSGRPLAPIGSLLYILLLVPPLARILKGVPRAGGVSAGELRQEA